MTVTITKALAALFLLAVTAGTALAQPSLTGQEITVYVLTYDDPARPLFFGKLHAATVGEGIEFGLGPEGVQNDIDVAPNQIDIGESRIEISYEPFGGPGVLVTSRFNGYIFSVAPSCLLFAAARIDRKATNVEIEDSAITLHGPSLRLNVSGLRFDQDSLIAIDLDIRGCPVS